MLFIELLFLIQTYHLLMAADHPHFCYGRQLHYLHQLRVDVLLGQDALQGLPTFVITDQTQQGHLAIESGNVFGDVGGTTGLVFKAINFNHRNRCLR